MFFKKKQKLLYPKVVYVNREYYEVPLTAVKKLEKVRVKVSGKITSKLEIKYYSTGSPWSLETRIEEGHGHEIVFMISEVTVFFKRVAFLKKGEEVTVYGEVRNSVVYAEVIETNDIIYVKE